MKNQRWVGSVIIIGAAWKTLIREVRSLVPGSADSLYVSPVLDSH